MLGWLVPGRGKNGSSQVKNSNLSNNLINPPPLQPAHLLLKSLNLLPTVQRPAVVLAQAPHHLAARRLHALGQLAHLAALLELGAQGLNFLVDLLSADGVVLLLLLLLLLLGRLGRGCEGVLQLGGFGGAETLQFFGDAGLDLELEGLLAGDVGLISLGMRVSLCFLRSHWSIALAGW